MQTKCRKDQQNKQSCSYNDQEKKDGSLKLFISEMKEGLLLPIMQKN